MVKGQTTWGLRILVVGCLVAAALWLRGRTPEPLREGAPGPEGRPPSEFHSPAADNSDWSDASQTVDDFFQAAGDGDDEVYLRLVDGPLRTSLEQTRSDVGVDQFRKSLKRSAAGIKGLAITPGQGNSDGAVALDVEIVFTDRNEYQQMLLTRKGRGWVITSIDTAEMIKPGVPYGTSVFEEVEEE